MSLTNVRVRFAMVAALMTMAAPAARASFHFMQIEQVIGGVGGDTSAQAIQLRMRAAGQNQVQLTRLVARDAAGANPILLVDMTTSVPNAAAGSRVLIATASFQSYLTPSVTPDFIMANPIPVSYLAAGTLTFEQDPPTSTIYWRLSWGGASYTGPGTGAVTNDADGNFNPPFPSSLPAATDQAVRFQGAASALSTNNAADYQLTPGPAVVTNNAGQTGTVTLLPDCNSNGIPDDEDIAQGTSADCNANDTPDECDIAEGTSGDCNTNDSPDECEGGSGDSDGDGQITLGDYPALAGCLTGDLCEPSCPTPAYGDPCCILVDADGDGDVDLADFAAFQSAFSP